MRKVRRPVSVLLSVCLLLWVSGCYSAQDYAGQSGAMLSPGMTMDEVEARLGEPNLVVRGDPGTDTTWVYRYEGGPSTVGTVFLALFFVALIVVLVAAGGGSGGFGGSWGGGGGNDPPYQIKLLFDPAGRLLEVSPPQPVEVP